MRYNMNTYTERCLQRARICLADYCQAASDVEKHRGETDRRQFYIALEAARIHIEATDEWYRKAERYQWLYDHRLMRQHGFKHYDREAYKCVVQ